MIRRILAVLRARNIEFVRDRSSLGWNFIVPFALVFGLAYIFSGENNDQFTVAVVSTAPLQETSHPFLDTRYVDFVPIEGSARAVDDAVRNVARHQLDMLLDIRGAPRYWVNLDSPTGYVVERLLLQSDPDARKQVVAGQAVRYVDWLVPGVLGMNMTFSCLFGVGYAVVRYRKNGFLKRLRATPLTALEFIVAQVLSRLIIVMAVTTIVFTGVKLLLDIRMEGSYLALALVAMLGCSTLISLALVVAARVTSEELAGGVLNMISWPMMLLSGVFFSLEGTHPWLHTLSAFLPLTQVLTAARAVMIDGATLTQIWLPLTSLAVMTGLFLALGSALFKWRFT